MANDTPSVPGPLVVLPNGEAVRAHEVRRVVIAPAAAPARLEGQRFRVVLELLDGTRLAVATGLARPDAQDLARRCARAVEGSGSRP